jgi:hypothetical protein
MSAAAATFAVIGMSVWSGRLGLDRRPTPERPSADAGIEDFVRDAGFPADVARAVTSRLRAQAHPEPPRDLHSILEAIGGGL